MTAPCRKCATTRIVTRPRPLMRLLLANPSDTARRLGVSERLVYRARDGQVSPTFIAAFLAWYHSDPGTEPFDGYFARETAHA